MPKTEVILTANIVGLGAESDQVKVAAGYARNYLFPQRLAIPVTAANKRRLEVLRQRRAEREAHELNTMTELSKTLSKITLVIKVKTGEEGKLFGAVTGGTITDELKHQYDVVLDKKKLHLVNPLRTLGDHDVELRLHPEVTTTMKVRMESTTPMPKPEETPALAGKEGAGKPEAKRAEGKRPEGRPERVEPKPRPEKKEKEKDAR
jgi:large subunit ribosomal protein L9